MQNAIAATIRILIIDDHKTVVWGLERLIESTSPRMKVVGSALTASDALPLIVETDPDVIVLDLDLGAESGLSVIPRIAECHRARVLVVTGVRDRAVHEAAAVAGARGVISKEAAPSEILQAIEKVHRGELLMDRKTSERLLAGPARSRMTPASQEAEKVAVLTARERAITVAVCGAPAHSLKVVADQLGISERTLRNHLTSIYEKLGLSGRLELYVYATKHGFGTRPA